MGLFKKKKREEEIPKLPDLPELPRLPDISENVEEFPEKTGLPRAPVIKDELPFLPTLPSSKATDRLSRETIKTAIEPEPRLIRPYTREIESPGQKEVRRRFVQEIPEEINVIPRISEAEPKSKTGPVFVRIDKFQSAIRNLNDVRIKIAEIERLLVEIKELKTKEEAELSSWEEEILNIKSKLDSMDRNIFSKIE